MSALSGKLRSRHAEDVPETDDSLTSVPLTNELSRRTEVTLPRVNLLPPEIAQARQLRLVKGGMGVGVVAALGVVGLLFLSAASTVSDAQTELDSASTLQAQVQRQVGELANVRTVYADVATRETLLTRAMGPEVRWSQYLTDLSLTIPATVWVTNVTVVQNVDGPSAGVADSLLDPGIGSVTFTGTALAHDDVAGFLDALAGQQGYAFPYFSSSTEKYIGDTSVVDFTSTVNVTPEAQSGRYSDPAGDQR